ncbi:MAG: PQQ-dependent sugar dehydrogenase, partial [Rhodobacteraceae bacterium]|nr:PQQ-dependent sugar dehydrogenase [Paracoccaceae bacterium]
MHRRRFMITSIAASAAAGLASVPAHALTTSAGAMSVSTMATGLRDPWAVGFLPDGALLVTEKAGRLLHLEGGQSRAVSGLPEVAARGQGGLLDILVPKDFARSREIYLTYSKPQSGGAGTVVARATLSDDAKRLRDWRDIFELTPGSSGGRHFGSRLVE